MRFRRRLLTIPGFVLAWLVWLSTAPLWIPLAIMVDAVRRSRGVALRSATFASIYLTCEVLGMLASGALWISRFVFRTDDELWTDRHYRLETWWGSTLFRAIAWLFGLRVEVEGGVELDRGPYLLLVRHASSGDTLLASALVSKPHGVRLRYVLKRELLWDPCLDIVGNRLPNVFIDRESEDSQGEIRRVQELARDLGPRDGVLVYPEGTRFAESKRRRILERFERNGDAAMLEYASSLARVLPPRPGGTLGLLDAAPKTDVVICSHTGFEGAASFGRIWNGSLLDQVIRVQFRRIPHHEIPDGPEARTAWLFEEWRKVDAWVRSEQQRSASAPE